MPVDDLWTYADPAGSEARFREYIAGLDEDNRAERGEALTQIGRALCLQRRYDDALTILEQAASLADSSPRVAIRVALERSRVHNDCDHKPESIALAARARDLARDAGEDALAIDAMHMIGFIDLDPERAAAEHRRALALAAASPDPAARRWLGTLYGNIGVRHERLGELEQALACFEKCHTFRVEAGQTERSWAEGANIARIYRKLGRPADGEALVREVAAMAAEAHCEIGWLAEELAECLLAQGRDDEAREAFARTYELVSIDPWFPPDEPERLARIRKLGGLA